MTRRRATIVAFALVASVLAVSAQPVGAANASGSLEVASTTTTDSELADAQPLRNVSVTGSGAAGEVDTTTAPSTVEDYEDGSTTPNSHWSVQSTFNSIYSTTTQTALKGSTSGNITVGSGRAGRLKLGTNRNISPSRTSTIMRIESAPANGNSHQMRLYNSSSKVFFNIIFTDQNEIKVNGNVLTTYENGSQFSISVDLNWAAQSATVSVNGTEYGPFSFINQADSLNAIWFDVMAYNSPSQKTVYVDDIEVGGGQTYNPVYEAGDKQVDGTNSFVGDDLGNSALRAEVRIEPNESGTIEEVAPYIDTVVGSDYGASVDVYLVDGPPNAVYAPADPGSTLINDSWDPDWTTGRQEVRATEAQPTVQAGQTYHLEFITQGFSNNNADDFVGINVDTSASGTWYHVSDLGNKSNYAELDVDIASAPATARYVSRNVTADRVEKATVNLSLNGYDADVYWEAWDGSQWIEQGYRSTSSNGNQTVPWSISCAPSQDCDPPSDYSTHRIRVEFTRTGGLSSSASLHDHALLFEASAPSGSNASPSGKVDPYGGSISLDVSDPDFATAQGDSVAVTATDSDRNTQIGQTSIGSNQTVSFPYSALAGSNNVTWTLEDSYGQSSTVTQQFSTPSNLTVFRETKPSTCVDDVNLTFRFFGGPDEVVTRRVQQNCTVDLGGLPAHDQFTVTVTEDAGDYYYRRTIIESLYEQQEIYLLARNQSGVQVEFLLQDFTGGEYPPQETTLFVEKPIEKDFNGDGNNTTRYQVIFGDEFGAAGKFPAVLQQSHRYRLRVVDNEGNQRILGAYQPTVAQTETVTIRGLELDPPDNQPYETNLSTSNQGGNITWKFSDPTNGTTSLNVTIYERGNRSNVAYQDTAAGPLSNYSVYQVPVNNSTEWVLNWSASRGGQQIGQSRPVGSSIGLRIPFDSDWLGTLGMLTIAFVASLAGERKGAYVAVSVVSMAGVLMALRAVTILVPMWWLAALIAAGGLLYERQQVGA